MITPSGVTPWQNAIGPSKRPGVRARVVRASATARPSGPSSERPNGNGWKRGSPARRTTACTDTVSPRAAAQATALARTLSQGAEGDGVAQVLRRRDRVLPRRANRAGEQVRRAWLEIELPNAPLLALSALEAHPARRSKRDPDHGTEHRRVAVPPDPGTRRVAREIGRAHV